MTRVLQLPPSRFGLPLAAVTKAYRFIERWILRGTCLWAMKRVLQLPPSRFGLPLDALLRRIGLFERGSYA